MLDSIGVYVDEMYAAIEDPNQHHVDLYTSGSETYAQIQPPPNSNPIIIAVEINNELPLTDNPIITSATRQQTVDDDGNCNITNTSQQYHFVIGMPLYISYVFMHSKNENPFVIQWIGFSIYLICYLFLPISQKVVFLYFI